jgi:hypothetical protein
MPETLCILIHEATKEGGNDMPRLAYLRGDDIEIALAEEHLPEMKDVAKNLGFRRLAPVHGDPSLNRDAEGVAVLQCIRCNGSGLPHEMLANIDGRPFVDYEHERCPEKRTV